MLNAKSIIIGSIIVFGLYMWIFSSATKWADNISKQTEKNFADAIRTMQNAK